MFIITEDGRFIIRERTLSAESAEELALSYAILKAVHDLKTVK